MDWLNLHVSTLDSAEFVGATPTERATWLCLMRFCIGQENGGRILECEDWGDARWQQMCRVKLKEVRAESDLWYWEEYNLVVKFYPKKAERAVKKNRKDGHKGGRPKKNEENPPDKGGDGSDKTDPRNERVRVKVSGGKVNETKGEGGKGKEGDSGQQDPKAIPSGRPTTTRPTWAEANPETFKTMMEAFNDQNAKPMTVVIYFRGRMQTKRDGDITPEWERRVQGMSATEVFLVFANQPADAIQMPSQFDEAKRQFFVLNAN